MKKYNIWGILAVWSFIISIVLFLIAFPILYFFPLTVPDWFVTFVSWAFPALLAIFVISSGAFTNDFAGAIKRARKRAEREQKEKGE